MQAEKIEGMTILVLFPNMHCSGVPHALINLVVKERRSLGYHTNTLSGWLAIIQHMLWRQLQSQEFSTSCLWMLWSSILYRYIMGSSNHYNHLTGLHSVRLLPCSTLISQSIFHNCSTYIMCSNQDSLQTMAIMSVERLLVVFYSSLESSCVFDVRTMATVCMLYKTYRVIKVGKCDDRASKSLVIPLWCDNHLHHEIWDQIRATGRPPLLRNINKSDTD